MPYLGAHMSIAGGYYKATEAAAALDMDTVQIFTKNNNQWRAKDISPAEAEIFRSKIVELKLVHPLSHSSYLLNLASPDPLLRQKSIDACVVELQRAEQLGIRYVVIHPGAHLEAGEAQGIANVVLSLNETLARTSDLTCGILLETTAGQGSSLGHRFEHLAEMLAGVERRQRMGVCVDTCHIFAAGYRLHSKREYTATLSEFDSVIGINEIRAFHLNDSKKDLGSRVDRHEHIGRGKLGPEPFRHLLNDPRFREHPMYLETPKGTEDGENLDAINLRTLRGLIKRRARRA